MYLLRLRYFAALVFGLFLAGCRGGAEGASDRVKVYKVKGRITMSGAPVANAMVSFSPKSKQPVATGRTGSDGQFTLTTYDSGDGAAAGEYVVLVTKEIAAAGAKAADAGHDANNTKPVEAPAMHNADQGAEASTAGLPLRYSLAKESDLPATVKPDDSNDLTFDLKP